MNILKKFKKLFDPIDLTKGNIFHVFILFLIPIMLSIVFQQVYSLTDTIIVGQNLSDNEIAGVNDAVPIANMVLDFTIGCTGGFSVIMAKAIGEKNLTKARRSFFVQIIAGIFLSVIIAIASYFLIDPLLSWVNITSSETNANMQAIYESARTYLMILILGGIFAQMLYNMIVSVLRSLGDSFTPFLFLVFATILNVGLDLLFIVVFKWGVAGSAWATIMSQFIAAILAFIYSFVRYKDLRFGKEDIKVSFRFIFDHLKLGIPLGFQWSILYLGVIIMSASVIPFDVINADMMVAGNPAQVGYGVANKLGGLLMGPLNALGMGLMSFISQNRGAKEHERVKKGFNLSCIIAFIMSIALCAIGLLLTINGAYQYIFLAKDKVSETSIKFGNTYLYVSLPFFVVLCYIYIGRNAIQAFEKPVYPLIGGIVELITRLCVCLFLPEIINGGAIDASAKFGSFIAVCSADPITWFFSAVVVMIPSFYYVKKTINEYKAVEQKDIEKVD